jgi:hypothetical protein
MSDIEKIITIMKMHEVPCKRKNNQAGCTVIAAGRKFYANKDGEIYKVEEL